MSRTKVTYYGIGCDGWLCEAEVEDSMTSTEFYGREDVVERAKELGWQLKGWLGKHLCPDCARKVKLPDAEIGDKIQ